MVPEINLLTTLAQWNVENLPYQANLIDYKFSNWTEQNLVDSS